jgi:hypothetical protein
MEPVCRGKLRLEVELFTLVRKRRQSMNVPCKKSDTAVYFSQTLYCWEVALFVFTGPPVLYTLLLL